MTQMVQVQVVPCAVNIQFHVARWVSEAEHNVAVEVKHVGGWVYYTHGRIDASQKMIHPQINPFVVANTQWLLDDSVAAFGQTMCTGVIWCPHNVFVQNVAVRTLYHGGKIGILNAIAEGRCCNPLNFLPSQQFHKRPRHTNNDNTVAAHTHVERSLWAKMDVLMPGTFSTRWPWIMAKQCP